MKNFCLLFAAVIAVGCFLILPCDSGTPCPPRGELYPCMCINIPQSKNQIFTIVTCRQVPNTVSLTSIMTTLRGMRIDRFILYDSFWGAKTELSQLPQNFLTLLMIREIEIHDSALSSCFACDVTAGCPNKYVHGLSIYNSSSAANTCSTCDNKRWWMACVPELKHFDFYNNKLKTIDKDLFSIGMQKLTHLNFSYNEIDKIGDGAFKNLPKLVSLDLSHNKIADLSSDIFAVESPLTYLDLSYNMITKLSSNIFKYTPSLKTLLATNNLIRKVLYSDWKHLSKKILTVDLNMNHIHCDCHLIWLNCTTKAHVKFLGYCSNEGFDQTPLRRVSRYVSERCVDDQLLDQRRNKTEPNGCHEFLLKQKDTLQLLELNRVAPNRRDRKPVVTSKPR